MTAEPATSMIPEPVDVREAHRFDAAPLEAYLRECVPGFAGPLTVRQFRGGQSNPTYHLGTPDRQYVLRRKPPGKLLPSAHAVDREYRVITALAGSGVPVPATYAYCDDPDVIGTPFYVMEYVRGRVFPDPALPGVTPAERGAMYDSMNQVLARLHTVDWRAAGLEDRFLALAPDVLAGVGPDDLRTAYLRACAPRPVPRVDTAHVAPIRASVADAVAELVDELPRLRRTSFRALTNGLAGRLDVIVRFLALLELFKQGLVELEQAAVFGEIRIEWTGGQDASLATVHAGLDDYEG